MKLCRLLKERIDGGIGAASTGYLGKFPSLASVYNWGYKGYYQGPEQDLKPEISQETENQLIDQAIDLMYSRFPEIIKNKENPAVIKALRKNLDSYYKGMKKYYDKRPAQTFHLD